MFGSSKEQPVNTERPDDRAIIRELYELAITDDERGLLQFRSIVSGHQYRWVYRQFRNYIDAGADVLDWGSGNGHFSYFLQRAGFRATGYSLEPFGYEDLLVDHSYRFVPGDAGEPVKLPFDDASFDAVASIGVLEHVRETGGSEDASLAEIARVLRPGGHFVCCHFPNRYSWIDWAAHHSPCKHAHDFRYTRDDIVSLMRGAGLDLVKASRYGLLPRNQWHGAPGELRRSEVLATVWDLLDDVLEIPFGRFAQNLAFVSQKARDPAV